VSFDGTANIDLPGVNTTGNQNTSGNAATATALETARNINGVSFDGTGNITVNGLNYDVNDSWLRENGDNAHFKQYGNSRQMVFRTDGTTQYASDVGAYPFAWMYGGDAASDRRMLLNTSGQLWCSNYGWLHDKFMARTQVFSDTNSNASFTGQKIDFNSSGSQANTTDRSHIAFHIDMDSSATGGDTNHEHRMYGIYNDVRHSGDSDLVYGIYNLVRSDHTSGTTTNLRAAEFVAVASGTGTNTNVFGLNSYALKDAGSNGTTANMYGVRGEVEVDAGTCTNAYAFQAHIDRDGGTITTGYLYYGSYSGTVGTKYGVYVTGETKNYFSGNVGAGTASPKSKLDVYQGGNLAFGGASATLADSPGLTLSSSGAKWGLFINTNNDLIFVGKSGATGSYVGVAGFVYSGNRDRLMNFTGQHRTFIKDVPFTQVENLEGLIVSADNNKYIKMSGGIEVGSNAITTNESLPMVSLSTITNDKKCFGVISQSEDPEKREDKFGNFVTPYQKELGDTRVYINSVGEGAMWVTDINGPLESGDYITTSNVAGYGQKQNSEFLANYTVAKITMDCDFTPRTQPKKIIKKELANVDYWIDYATSEIKQEEYETLPENEREIREDKYYKIYKREIQKTNPEDDKFVHEVHEELVNVLDEHGQLQWEDDPSGATEKAYKIRYLDTDGNITDEANAVHIAAFVGCTYHCG
jgi:hypothetical protein